MFFVNIIHKDCNLIEYAVLQSFLRFFGISVYNSSAKNLSEALLVCKNDSNAAEKVNIVVVDKIDEKEKIERRLDSYSVDGNKNIFVFSIHSTGNFGKIKFPEKFQDKDLKSFLLDILKKMCNILFRSSVEKVRMYAEELEHQSYLMVEMFLHFDIIKNWYIPIRVLKSPKYTIDACVNLKSCIQEDMNVKQVISAEGYRYIKYAYVHAQYMVNRMCNKVGIEPLIDWKQVLKCAGLLEINSEEYSFLLGEIYDESGRYNVLADQLYLMSHNSFDYYVLYRHAKLREFKYSDRHTAGKFFDKSQQINPHYYRSIYKMALYFDESNQCEEAYKKYAEIINILLYRLNAKHWNRIDMEYLVKSCGRLMGLNRFFKSSVIMQVAEEIVDIIEKNIENNLFFAEVASFIYEDEEATNEFCKAIIKDAKENAEKHIKDFCSPYILKSKTD